MVSKGEKESKIDAGKGVIKEKDAVNTGMGRGRGRGGFSIASLFKENERRTGVGRGGFPINKSEGKMGMFGQMEKKRDENVSMEEGNKYEKAQVMNVEEDEKEIKIDPKLVEAVAKKLKEWRE